MEKFEKDKAKLAEADTVSYSSSDSVSNYLFDSRRGELLGRSFSSWLKLLLFYGLFCSLLALLWGLCIGVFFQTLDFYIPKYIQNEGLLGNFGLQLFTCLNFWPRAMVSCPLSFLKVNWTMSDLSFVLIESDVWIFNHDHFDHRRIGPNFSNWIQQRLIFLFVGLQERTPAWGSGRLAGWGSAMTRERTRQRARTPLLSGSATARAVTGRHSSRTWTSFSSSTNRGSLLTRAPASPSVTSTLTLSTGKRTIKIFQYNLKPYQSYTLWVPGLWTTSCFAGETELTAFSLILPSYFEPVCFTVLLLIRHCAQQKPEREEQSEGQELRVQQGVAQRPELRLQVHHTGGLWVKKWKK